MKINLMTVFLLLAFCASMEAQIRDNVQLMVQRGHADDIVKICFSPNDEFIASYGMDGIIFIWGVNYAAVFSQTNWPYGKPKSMGFIDEQTLFISSDSKIGIWNIYTNSWNFNTGNRESELRRLRDSDIKIEIIQSKFVKYSWADNTWKKRFSGTTQYVNDQFNGWDVDPSQSRIALAGSDAHVYLFNFQTGKRLKQLKGHLSDVTDVCYSHNGKYLASASKDRTIIIWDVATLKKISMLYARSFRNYSVAFDSSSTRLAIGDEFGTIKIFDLNNPLSEMRGYTRHYHPVTTLNWQGTELWSSSLDNTISILNFERSSKVRNFKYVHTLDSDKRRARQYQKWFGLHYEPYAGATCFAASPDYSRKVWGGFRVNLFYEKYNSPLTLYPFLNKTNDLRFVKSRTGILKLLLRDRLVDFANAKIFLLDSKRKKPKRLVGHEIVFSMYFPDNNHLLSTDGVSNLFQWKFDGKEIFYKVDTLKEALVSIRGLNDSSIVFLRLGNIEVRNWPGLQTRQSLPCIGYRIDIHKKNNLICVASAGNSIVLYRYHSNKLDSLGVFNGHTDLITDLRFSPDGRYIVSSSLDATVRLWNIVNPDKNLTLIPIGQSGTVLVNSENYYTISKNYVCAIGFKSNKSFTLADQYDLKFNRPDIIAESFSSISDTLRSAYRKAYQKRLQKMGFKVDMLASNVQAPIVRIARNQIPLQTMEAGITVDISAFDSTYRLDRLTIHVNDVPIHGRKGINLQEMHSKQFQQMLTIPLTPGNNKVQISAMNMAGVESEKETFNIECTRSDGLPNLYFVGIGAGTFANTEMNLKFPQKDIDDLAAFFKTDKKRYADVFIDTLYNTSIDKERIAAIRNRLMLTKPDDRVILFIAGHGLIDDSLDYFFPVYRTNFNQPRTTALPYDVFEDLLDGIPARKKLMLVDACHAGEIDKESMQVVDNQQRIEGEVRFRAYGNSPASKQLGLQNSFELMKELFMDLRRGTGTTVIASASGVEFAMESDRWNNSVFMFALLKGLRSKKIDSDRDGSIMVSELKPFLDAEVDKLTEGRQKPTSRAENVSNDWRIW